MTRNRYSLREIFPALSFLSLFYFVIVFAVLVFGRPAQSQATCDSIPETAIELHEDRCFEVFVDGIVYATKACSRGNGEEWYSLRSARTPTYCGDYPIHNCLPNWWEGQDIHWRFPFSEEPKC